VSQHVSRESCLIHASRRFTHFEYYVFHHKLLSSTLGMSHGKQFTLYTHTIGPNGWKVAFALAELGPTYESIYLDFAKGDHKAPEHTRYNPNGRIPTLIDHRNGDFVIWESDAILVYLVDSYDTEHKISVADVKEKIIQLQWLFFQASGQGPYFGQAYWFLHLDAEKIPSAIKRYQKETYRVLSILEIAEANAGGTSSLRAGSLRIILA